jgi:putative photosynthetic complex assembly protein 2
MLETPLTIVAVLFAWWASTGLVLALAWLGPTARGLAFVATTVAAAAGLVAVALSARADTAGAVWLGFTSALVVWAWHELAFLGGLVTGPNRAPCPPDARGLRRFYLATLTVIHHELALFATLVLIVALTWGAPSQVAPLTFAALWVMRLSSKLNLFFGVRNVSHGFLPEPLRFLPTYFGRSGRSRGLGLSIAAGTFSVVACVGVKASLALSAAQQLGLTMVATMLALGVLEHVFLAVPLGDAALWQWIIRSRERRGPALSSASPPVRP